MLHKRVEAMLQKWCRSGVAEDFAEVVLQKMLLQKKTSASVVRCTSTFFFFASFSLLFFCLGVVNDGESA
jgi:hypothetical protein